MGYSLIPQHSSFLVSVQWSGKMVEKSWTCKLKVTSHTRFFFGHLHEAHSFRQNLLPIMCRDFIYNYFIKSYEYYDIHVLRRCSKNSCNTSHSKFPHAKT